MGGQLVIRDVGHGRGWLEDEAAKSQARIDAALGHPQQTTELGRSYEQQDVHYQHFLKWGYPIALPPWTPSVHQLGRAKDTDERNTPLLNDHGWYHTVYRNGKLVEEWHYEYFPELDNHRNEPVVLTQDADGIWRYHVLEDEVLTDLFSAFKYGGGQKVAPGESALLYLNDKREVSVATGPAKNVQGNLTIYLEGGQPYASSVQVTPLVETYKDSKRVSTASLGADEIILTPGSTIRKVPVSCALREGDRLRFRITNVDAGGPVTVTSAVFRGSKTN